MAKKRFYETDEFKETQKHWYSKLAESGFKDIDPGDDTQIRQEIIKPSEQSQVGVPEYTELCNRILREYKFKRPVDRVVFELHSQGQSVRFIEQYLKDHNLRPLKKTAINDLIEQTKVRFLKGA